VVALAERRERKGVRRRASEDEIDVAVCLEELAKGIAGVARVGVVISAFPFLLSTFCFLLSALSHALPQVRIH
jgi:hypothetical protein